MTFCTVILFFVLMMVSRHEVGAGVWHTAWCFDLQVSQASKYQWLIAPCKVVETPYQLDRGPSILAAQMPVSKISPSCKLKYIKKKKKTIRLRNRSFHRIQVIRIHNTSQIWK